VVNCIQGGEEVKGYPRRSCILGLGYLLLVTSGLAAQEKAPDSVFYSVALNIAPSDFRIPLMGLVNLSRGNQDLPQFGLFNWNAGSFSSLQFSMFNMALGGARGLQLGIANVSTGQASKSFQLGLTNFQKGQCEGLQFGLANFRAQLSKGVQFGVLNIAASNKEDTKGVQAGLANISGGSLKGLQIGLFNLVNDVVSGVPVGLLSVVRHGGYYAIEASFDEAMPVNLALKIGVKKFYTSLIASYDPTISVGREPRAAFGFGAGFGSIFSFKKTAFFINPEISYVTIIQFKQQFVNLRILGGYQFNDHFSFVIGPSFNYMHVGEDSDNTAPVFKAGSEVTAGNLLMFGLKAGVRFEF
jgi:hypothetical protein